MFYDIQKLEGGVQGRVSKVRRTEDTTGKKKQQDKRAERIVCVWQFTITIAHSAK